MPTVPVVPPSAAKLKVPGTSRPTLPPSTPVKVASLLSPSTFGTARSPTVLAGLPAGGPLSPSSSTEAAAMPLVGTFASITWKLIAAVAVSPSPSVTVNVALVGATGLVVGFAAVNEYDPSAFTLIEPEPIAIACE